MSKDSEAHLVAHYSHLGQFDKDFRNANLFRLVAGLISEQSIVDIGCGAGFFGHMLIKQGKQVTGIEPNEGMRALAQKVDPRLRIIAGSAEEVAELVSFTPDCVTMLDVLEHIEDDRAHVARVHTLLKENGLFVIVVPAQPYLYGVRDREAGHYRRYSKKGLKELLEQGGFDVVSIRHWNALGFFPYLISEKILKRPLRVGLREQKKSSWIYESLRVCINAWMKYIENTFNFGFGLSIICFARKRE